MSYKVKGILLSIGNISTTKLGTAVQQIEVEQENGKVFYPQCLGTKIELLADFLPGDVVEVKFHISGSNRKFNNCIIEDITRI